MEAKLKTIAIVQARMGSSRYSGKVLAELCGKPMIGVLLHRLELTKGLDGVVVATTVDPTDDILVRWLESEGVPYFRGSVNDVLDRFWRCATEFAAEIIVRITADDPLKDPEVVGRAIDQIRSSNDLDYVSNTINPSYPEGLDVEVFTIEALCRANSEATLPSEREHVTPYIWKNPHKFSILNFEMSPNLSSWRWTVDKPEDLIFVRDVLRHFDDDIEISYKNVIDLIMEKPELAVINSGTVRNEGYLKSIDLE